MSKLTRVIEAAKKYTGWGCSVIPVPAKQKGPRLENWQNLRLHKTEIAAYFDDRNNIGILLGEPSNGRIDVDLDCEQAIFLAPHFLPETKRIHGRKSKPNSHFWFRATPTPAPQKFCDVDRSCLVELRSTGQQTIVPPSIHPSGERVRWYTRGGMGQVGDVEILSAVKRLAAASLIARHWPSTGTRHDTSLALTGMLLQAQWNETETQEFVSLVAQAAGDEEWKARRSDARTTQKRLLTGRKITGRPRLEKLLGANVVACACEWLGISGFPTSTVPLAGGQTAWPKSIAERAFCGLAGDVVRAIEPLTEADESGLLVQFLICFGNVIGRNAHFRIGAAKHHTNLFGVLVGRTAKSRKGTSWTEIEHLFEQADPVWAERCLQPGGLASGEGMTWAVRDPIKKQLRPRVGNRKGQDRTKIVDKGVEDKRLLVIEAEFASPLRVARREGNILSGTLRLAWDKGNLGNMTKQTSVRATGAHISIIGHITRDELLREFSAAEGHNGLANRFLWVCVRRTKFRPLGGRLKGEIAAALASRLKDALVFGCKTGEVRFTKRAKKLWCQKVYPKLGADVPGLLGAVISRAEPQVLRLSIIYALLDNSMFISPKHLQAANAAWRYCADSARFIFGDALGDATADSLLAHLRQNEKGLTRNEIRESFSRNRSEREISNALRLLKEYRFVRRVREETGGRPSERWFAVR